VLGVLFVAGFAAKFPKKPTFVVFFLIAILSTAVYFVLPREQIFWLFAFDLIGPLASAPLPVLLWSMYADTADYGEWKTGRRATALVFSASTMGQKLAWAFGGFFAFQLLSSVGFQANVVPSAAVQESLVWLMSLAPSALGILSIAIFLFYPLDDQRVAGIEADLMKRRAAATGA
jgi:GPH family glycoside/pentoside/hexuronide:cation symporter